MKGIFKNENMNLCVTIYNIFLNDSTGPQFDVLSDRFGGMVDSNFLFDLSEPFF